MSELVVAGFPDVLRAAQVVTELHRIDVAWSRELEHAVTIAFRDDGRLLVQQTIDPAAGDSAAWSGLWVALIRDTLMMPSIEGMPDPTTAARRAMGGERLDSRDAGAPRPRPFWWTEEVGLSIDFMRDVGALIGPGESALYLLLREIEPARAHSQLRRLGGTVVRFPLDEVQDAKVQTVLAGSVT